MLCTFKILMSEEEAEQFLSLISENAQLKAEIMSLRKYDRAIRTLDRRILTVFTKEVVGSDRPAPNLKPLISEICLGVTPVESSESFKERMKNERAKKLSEIQKSKIAELEQAIGGTKGKERELNHAISDLETKIAEHQKIIAEAQTIKDNFCKQVDMISSAIEKIVKHRDQLTDQVTREQAIGLELRRNIEQSKRNVSQLRSQQTES